MVEFLVGVAQATCITGLLYGAYLCITYSDDGERASAPVRSDSAASQAWMNAPETLRHV